MKRLSRAMIILLLLSGGTAAQAWWGQDDDEGRALWSAGEQFVRIVPVEEGAQENSHPVTLPAGDLRRVLAAVQTRERKSIFYFGIDEPIPVFTHGMIDVLTKSLVAGLAEAQPGEDLVFLLQGQYTRLSFFRNVHAVGARVFYRDGVLHMVFGDVLRPVAASSSTNYELRGLGNEVADKRTHPYRTGRREREGSPGWELVETAGMQRHQSSAGKARVDWLVIDVTEALAALPEPEAEPAAGGGGRAPAAASTTMEARQMRLEMARMRQEIKELRDGSPTGGSGNAEQRLHTLKLLREQDLITEEEFQQKRTAILEEL